MRDKSIPIQIVNPFSDKFIETWQMWKDYKKETFGFTYKGFYSEQMTLKQLVTLSDGEEEKAVRIIEQSIMRQWQGIFPLHTPSANGKKSKQTTTNSNTTEGKQQFRSAVNDEFNRRYGGKGYEDGEPHLKAV